MSLSATAHERVAVHVPAFGRPGDGELHFGPRLEAAPLERERPQHLPPRLEEIQIGRVHGREDELPAWMREREEQHLGRAVRAQVVEHRIDPRYARGHPGVDLREEVDPVGRCPARVALFQRVARRPSRAGDAGDRNLSSRVV